MLQRLDELNRNIRGTTADEHEADGSVFAPLRVLTAQLLLVTAAEAVLDRLQREPEQRPLDYPPHRSARASAAALAPSLLAPLAAAAHLTHLAGPSRSTDLATRVLDTAVVGVSVGAALAALVAGRGRSVSGATAPLALATAGVLGLVLDRQERAHADAHRRLARRASVVERLVPARRGRLDHIVVHI